MLRSNYIGNLTGVYNSKILGKQHFTSFRHEDYVAWISLIKKAGTAYGLPEFLANYRVYGSSTSANKFKAIGWQWRIYRVSEKLGRLNSVMLMLSYAFHALTKRV